MSQAQELLNSLTANVIDHKHEVPDSDTYFLIDPYTRQIENTNYNKTVLMRGDHNSERFTFEVPRFVDGHDMSLCNRVIVHFDNVGDSIEKVYSDVAYMEDLRINPDKPETVISSWLIRREATQIVGILSFSLQYQCVEDGEITYEWNTDSYDEIEIRKSKNNGEAAIINYTNVLEEWRSKIFGAGDSVMANISAEGATQVTAVQTESATQQAAIELKGSTTLASIPEDYTEVYNMAEEALRTKADSIVCEAEGSVIAINDSSDDYIRGLTIYGKSMQVTTTGKNKLNLGTLTERVVNGVTITPIYDDNGNLLHLSMKGTSTGTFIVLAIPFSLAAGEYIFTNFYDRTSEDRTLHCQICDSTAGLLYPQDAGLGGRFTFETDIDLIYRIYIQEGRSVDNVKLYPMFRDASIEDNAYEPYTGGVPSPNPEYPQKIAGVQNPNVDVCGRNLVRTNNNKDVTYEGLHFLITKGLSEVVLNGTTTKSYGYAISEGTYLAPGRYTMSIHGLNNVSTKYDQAYVMNTVTRKSICSEVKTGSPVTFDVVEGGIHRIDFLFAEGTTYNNATIRFQIEAGSVATDYEPCKPVQTTPLANTLHGIPVTSGGNYTDENGQQWICDEVDLERGVYIRRTGEIVFDGTKNYHINSYRLDYGYYAFGCTMEDLQPVNNMPLVSDKFTHKLWHDWQPETDRNLVCYTGYAFYFYLNDGVTKTAAAFKEYITKNPATVRHILPTPIETPLTAEEIEAYKSIKTNYPNTTILNDSGAWMKVKYNADLRRYIDRDKQQFTEDIIDQFRDTVTPAKIGWVTLPAAGWVGSDGLYSQVVDIPGVTENSQVDLTPDIEQLTIFYEKDLTFVTENDGGVVTVYAVGQKPENDYVVQVTITEVAV